MNCQGVAVQGTGSSPLMDGSMSSCCPLGWRHCDGKDSNDSLTVKSRPGDTKSAEHPTRAAGTLQLPLVLPSACPLPSLTIVLLLPLLTSDVSIEFLASLTFLSPPIPRAFPPPPLASALNYNEPSHPLSPKELLPHQHKLLDRGRGNVCSPLALSLRSGPIHPIFEPWDSLWFFNISRQLFMSSSDHTLCLHQNLCVPQSGDAHWCYNTLPGGGECICFNLGCRSQPAQFALAVPPYTSIRSLKLSRRHEHFTSIFSHLYF